VAITTGFRRAAALLLLLAAGPGRARGGEPATAGRPLFEGRFVFATYGRDDGLGDLNAESLLQDRTGFLWVRPGLVDLLRPLALGMGSFQRFNVETGELALHPGARRFEWGTQNDALFFALGAAIDFVDTIGLPRIWAHNHALAERFYNGLQAMAGVEILSPQEAAYRTAMISFRMKERTYQQINEHLAKAKIRVRPVTEGGLNCIRVSFHVCNHDPEVDAILAALRSLA